MLLLALASLGAYVVAGTRSGEPPSDAFANVPVLSALAATATPTTPPTPTPSPTPVPPAWLTTLREATLWSSADPDATAFTTVPVDSVLRRLEGPKNGRVLVDYPGDGAARQPGRVWVDAQDTAPGTAPAWLRTSAIPDVGQPSPPGGPTRTGRVAPPRVTARQIAVVDEASGLLLYGLDPHASEPPASTTKIATAAVALERASDLDAKVRVTVDGGAMAVRDGSSIMGLVPGSQLSVRTLLYGLLLPSGNDAAEQLALALAPSREQYVAWMNDLASRLGLHDTRFRNPSGLDDDGHEASAYDLAQLARYAMRNPTFRAIVSTTSYRAEGLLLEGHNPLLGAYPGADGVKTGSTDLAGRTMVASATRNGHRVYVVVMHSDDLLADCSALFDWSWRSFAWSAVAVPTASTTPVPGR